MNVFRIPPKWLTSPVKVMLVGAGGTGSRVLEQLLCLHRAMLAKGHPHGLRVVLVDMDRVSPSNIGRQAFYPSDIGSYKSHTLINRVNMALNGLGTWEAHTSPVTDSTDMSGVDLVIGAVDNRLARKSIHLALSRKSYGDSFWLDYGNRSNDGQVVFGQVPNRNQKIKNRLPHIGELYPELLDPSSEGEDDTPSCSLAEALEKQSLYINQAVSVFGMNILWNLFTKGEIDVHGAFVNLEYGMVTPLRADPVQWARFGVGPLAKRRRKPKSAVTA